jgi:CheY-like chemotaxis protein
MKLKPVVLSIDADQNFRNAVEIVLSRFGLHVKGVSTSAEFLESAKSIQPDLYLIDLQVKDCDGIDLVRRIRTKISPNAFIIVISGAVDPATATIALEQGANDYILKPIDQRLLLNKLSQFVETEEIRDQRAEWTEPTDGNAEVRLSFDGVIDEIDELGIKFISSTLVPKGTVLKMDTPLLAKVGLKEKSCLVTVTNTWLIPQTQQYEAYAEFDGVDLDFLNTIRRWLST